MGSLGGGQASGSRLPASKIGYTYHFFWASAFCFYICTICIFTFVFLHLHNLYNFTVLLPTYFPHYSALIGPRDGMLGNLPNNLNTTWLYFGLNRSKNRLRIHDLYHPSSGWKHKSNFSTPIALILSAHLKTLLFQLAKSELSCPVFHGLSHKFLGKDITHILLFQPNKKPLSPFLKLILV